MHGKVCISGDGLVLAFRMRALTFENLCTSLGKVDICQSAKEGGEAERDVWHSALVAACEDCWRFALGRESVECPACDVLVRVGRRNAEDQDSGVDDAGKHLDSGDAGGG